MGWLKRMLALPLVLYKRRKATRRMVSEIRKLNIRHKPTLIVKTNAPEGKYLVLRGNRRVKAADLILAGYDVTNA